MIKEIEIEKGLRDLFKYAFITNCRLDEVEPSQVEIQAVESIGPADVLEACRELVVALLRFKKEHILSRKDQTALQNINYLCRLESEIKTHEKTQQKLRQTIEFYQKIPCEPQESHSSPVVGQKKINFIDKKNEQVEDSKGCTYKQSLFHKNTEYDRLRTECVFNKNNFKSQEIFGMSTNYNEKDKCTKATFLKDKIKEKSLEIAQIQQKIREKIRNKSSISASKSKTPGIVVESLTNSEVTNTKKKNLLLESNKFTHLRSNSYRNPR
jgi:hypothetical protein